MWSTGIINVTKLKYLLIILGLSLPKTLSQNSEPDETGNQNGLERAALGHGYNGSALTTNPIRPTSTTTQTTKQPFNWQAFPKSEEGELDEKKNLLTRNPVTEQEAMPRAMSNEDNAEASSTSASTPKEESSGEGMRTATLRTVPRRKSRGERRRRVKQFMAEISRGKERNATTLELEGGSSGLGIHGEVNVELNSIRRPKKDRLNTQRGRVSSSRRKPKKSNGRDKEVQESREQRRRLRLERRRRRNRERKRRNKAHHNGKQGGSRRITKQNQTHDQTAPMLLAMPVAEHEINATKVAEEEGSNVKSSRGSRVRKVELSRKNISVNQQRDEPDAGKKKGFSIGVENRESKKTSGDHDNFQTHHDHKDNVEKEFSKQFEIELSKSKNLAENAQHWSSVESKLSKILTPDSSPRFNENVAKSLDKNMESPRFDGEKMLGYSVSENELPSDDANNEVLSRNIKYYQDYIANSLRLSEFPTSQLHSMYSFPELRRNSFPENSNISGLMAADHPTLLGHEQHPFGNLSKKDSLPNTHSKAELNDASAKSTRENSKQIGTNAPPNQTTDDDDFKGDLSCMNGTFLPAPLVRHALIKYVKSSTPGHEYLEADYECTPGYYIVTQARRLLCNNRRWVGGMPECKLRQNPNDVCANSPCEQVCREVNGNPMCACYKGFRQEGVKCIDVNECEKGNGGCDFICLNTPGSYRCECPKGMRQGESKYSCMDINECLLNNGHGPCQDKCENFEGGYRCSCEGLPGTALGPNNHTCQDAGPCGTNNAGCSHTCLSTMGRVFCLCPDGFMLEDDWKTCQDVDECAVPDLQSVVCQHGCINTPGSYRCADPPELRDEPPSNLLAKPCDPGFEPSVNGDCVDMNECSISNGGCLEVCENTLGSYFCACNGDERLLAADGRTCVDINDIACPVLNPSGRGYVMCSRLTTPKPWRGRKRVINRPGTKCFLRCPAGYQLRGEYELTCGTNGDWSGSKHGECVRYSKPRLDCPQNLIAEVPPGQSEAFVTFAQPSTDLDWFRYVRSEPSWGTRLEANLVPGEHKVTFIAKHPVSKKQATCTLHITVKPGEAPRIKNCPDNILTNGRNGTIVNWTEPIFTDNVKIINVISNKNPGHFLPVGEHKIHYEARDEAGWTATCEFLVTVKAD